MSTLFEEASDGNIGVNTGWAWGYGVVYKI